MAELPVGALSPEAIVQAMVDETEEKRRYNFQMGQYVLELAQARGGDKKARAVAVKEAAAALACTGRFAEQLASVYETFGWPAFYPDIPWSLYRALTATDDPHRWLGRAMAKGWSLRDLAVAYSKETGQKLDTGGKKVFLLKARGAVHVSGRTIRIEADEDPSLSPEFKTGAKARVVVER